MTVREKEATPTPQEDSRRQKEMRARREAILDVAEMIFSKKGYHDTSMAEIAKTAEFGVGYLYRHFTDKGDLYLAVVERKFDALLSALRAALASGGTIKDRLSTVVRVYFTFFEANRSFFRLATEQAHFELQKGHKERIIPRFLLARQEVFRLLNEGINTKDLKPLNPDHMTSVFFGMLHGCLGHWVHTDPDASLSDAADTVLVAFFSGVSAS